MKRALLLILCLGSLWLTPPAVAGPSKEDTAKAAKLFGEAEVHYKLQEFDQALAKYKEAYRLSQEPALLFNIAQCQRQMGRYDEALRSYKTFLRDDPKNAMETEVKKLIEELELLVAQTKTVERTTPDPTVTVPKPLEPASEPSIAAPEPGPVVGPAKTPASAPAEEPAPGGLSPMLLYGAAGTAGVVGVGAGALALSASIQARKLQQQDDTDLDQVEAKFRSARIFGLASDVLLVGAVAAGVGGVLRARQLKPELSLSVSPSGVALSRSF